jgi:3-hydroxybutyryl-CoA dehydratase
LNAKMIAPTAAKFSELDSFEIGQTASASHVISAEAVGLFASLSGDDNALHISDGYAQQVGFDSRVSHGALLIAYLSALLGTKLPGMGCLWMQQQVNWRSPVYIGNRIRISVRVKHKSVGTKLMTLAVEARNEDNGVLVMDGQAVVALPSKVTEPSE